MQFSIRLRFQLTQHLGEIHSIGMSSIKYHAALVPIALSISSLIYFLATSAKVPIRATLTTPSGEIIVDIHPGKSSSRFNLLQDKPEVTLTRLTSPPKGGSNEQNPRCIQAERLEVVTVLLKGHHKSTRPSSKPKAVMDAAR